MSKPLIVYGTPPSQPTRAVYWTCLLRGLPFELRLLDFGRLRQPEFTRLNPKAQVPTIDDGGFALYEMPAILERAVDAYGVNTGSASEARR